MIDVFCLTLRRSEAQNRVEFCKNNQQTQLNVLLIYLHFAHCGLECLIKMYLIEIPKPKPTKNEKLKTIIIILNNAKPTIYRTKKIDEKSNLYIARAFLLFRSPLWFSSLALSFLYSLFYCRFTVCACVCNFKPATITVITIWIIRTRTALSHSVYPVHTSYTLL